MRLWLPWWFLFCVGGMLALMPIPAYRATSYLRSFTRRAGLAFELDGRGRLGAGPQAERILLSMFRRLMRASGAALAGISLSYVVLFTGPPLSRSTPQSLVVAGLLCVGVLSPFLVLRPFLMAYSPSGPGRLRRSISVEDYLDPFRRVLSWFAVVSALSIPAGAWALASTVHYDGSKIFWEGVVGLPLVCAGVLVATELTLLGTRDDGANRASAYLWDVLRVRSVRLTVGIAMLGVGLAWQLVTGGLTGVALTGPRPEWLEGAVAFAKSMSIGCSVAGLLVLVAPLRRFRERLWTELADGETVLWPGVAAST